MQNKVLPATSAIEHEWGLYHATQAVSFMIALVIALSKVLDNNIVVNCIFTITCKKKIVLYMYVGFIYYFFRHDVTEILSVH